MYDKNRIAMHARHKIKKLKNPGKLTLTILCFTALTHVTHSPPLPCLQGKAERDKCIRPGVIEQAAGTLPTVFSRFPDLGLFHLLLSGS